MNATLVVREHSVPAPIIGTIGKHIFTLMSFAPVPALDENAFVQRQVYPAAAAATRRAGIRYRPIAQPVIELLPFRACRTRQRICCSERILTP